MGFGVSSGVELTAEPVPQLKNQAKKQPPEQFAEVTPGCRQHRVDRVPLKSSQEAAAHPVVLLQMADLGLDRTAAPAALLHGAAQLAARTARNVNRRGAFVVVTAIPLVDKRSLHWQAGCRFHFVQG